MKIKWENKMSHETGYVEKISMKDKCFFNTFEKENAKEYKSKNGAFQAIKILNDIGEGENNIFFIEE